MTLISFLIPSRVLNILAIFIMFDSLLSFLPGKFMFYGEQLWKWSRLVFALTLLYTLTFLAINAFAISGEMVTMFFTIMIGNLFLLMATIIIVIVILGLLGISAKKE